MLPSPHSPSPKKVSILKSKNYFSAHWVIKSDKARIILLILTVRLPFQYLENFRFPTQDNSMVFCIMLTGIVIDIYLNAIGKINKMYMAETQFLVRKISLQEILIWCMRINYCMCKMLNGYLIMNLHVLQCPPCRGFTPKLIETYNKVKDSGKSFEIIFVTSDRQPRISRNLFLIFFFT